LGEFSRHFAPSAVSKRKVEEPLSWFQSPCTRSRHTWSRRSYQRVSTFASGLTFVG